MTHITESEMKQKYLDLLSQKFDSAEKLATEIINLESILELPKGTEHFVSDLHGEYESFQHVLRNGSEMCVLKLMISSKINYPSKKSTT